MSTHNNDPYRPFEEIIKDIDTTKKRLLELGEKPSLQKLSNFQYLIMCTFLPIPWGFLFYFLVYMTIFSETVLALILIAVIISGARYYYKEKTYRKEYEEKCRPFLRLEQDLEKFRIELARAQHGLSYKEKLASFSN
jgi:hypothetical protein